MNNYIELSPAAYQWILRHPFVSEEKIKSIIQQTPISKRHYTDDNHFEIPFNTKSNNHILAVTVLIHDRITCYYVYGLHSHQ